MIHDNDVSNTEDNGNKPRGDRVTVPNEKFLFREPIVLISIVCLSLLNGLSLNLPSRTLVEMPQKVYIIYTSAVPVVGLIFAAFLSDVTGRKHIYRYLFALSLLSFIFVASSKHPTVISIVFILGGMIRGGSSVMNAVAITEYSSPKHRFTWMIVDKAASNTVGRVMSMLTSYPEVVFYILLAIQIVLGLISLGTTWAWPESPYWLANNGKLEQSRTAFMWLRGKAGRDELASVLKARRRPGPAKLFWISLLVALATISVSIFSHLQLLHSTIIYQHFNNEKPKSHFYFHLFGTAVMSSALAAASYFIRRKLIFIVVCVISVILCYAEAICLYLVFDSADDSMLFDLLHIITDVIQTSGPTVFGVSLFIEIAPHKYNTLISCICFMVMFASISVLVPLTLYLNRESFHPSASLALFTTFTLVAALLYYFFAPEAKDKTLLEIQKSYTPDENDSNTEQNQSIMLNAI